MVRMRCLLALCLFLGSTCVDALVPSATFAKDSAVKSPLFRAPTIADADKVEVPAAMASPRPLGMKKTMKHAATLTAAALLWSSVAVPDAQAARAASRSNKQKQAPPPVTRMTRVKQTLEEYKQFAPAGGAILVATGTGILLGRQTAPPAKDDDEKQQDSTTTRRSASEAAAVSSRIDKLNENRAKTQKILDRIAELESDDVVNQYQLRATAQEETQKILNRIRLEREQQDAILRAGESTMTAQEETQEILNRIRLERQQKSNILPPPEPTTATTSFADYIPPNGNSGAFDPYKEKLSTDEIVNALIDQHAKEFVAKESTKDESPSVSAEVDSADKSLAIKPPVTSSSDTIVETEPTEILETSATTEEKYKAIVEKLDATLEDAISIDEEKATAADADAGDKDRADINIAPEGKAIDKATTEDVLTEVEVGKDLVLKADTTTVDDTTEAVVDDKSEDLSHEVAEAKITTDIGDESTKMDAPVDGEAIEAKAPEILQETQKTPFAEMKVSTSTEAKEDVKFEPADVVEPTTNDIPVANGKESSVSKDKPAVPLEEVFPVKSTEIQLEEMSIDSVKSKSSWSPTLDEKSLEEKTFTMLADLGMVELNQDPKSKSYDASKDDDFVE